MKTQGRSTHVQTAQKIPNTTDRLEELKLLEAKKNLQEKLPHLYGFKLYRWQRTYIESHEKMNLICAANQIGKSACNVLKMITWATEPKLWPKLFTKRPRVFWYMHVTKDLMTTEFNTKWLNEFLPKGEFKNHPQYGWEAEFRSKHLWAIHFKSGVSMYVKTYGMEQEALQGSTVDAVFVDEEPPWHLMPEVLLRINARNGYYNGVLTPTQGQEMWRRCFEVEGDGEVFPDAHKQRVSMYDCQYFEDGTPSHWTTERINQTINRLGTQAEIDLRVHGKFVAQEGLKVPAFHRENNVRVFPDPVPTDWFWYSGVDIGSGGGNHPPAICFVAVRPDFQFGRVSRCWRGDGTKVYTATDVLEKYIELREGRTMAGEFYDWASKDFGTVAIRSSVGFQPAEKSHEIGYPMLNTLFKNQMLVIEDTVLTQDLRTELINLRATTNKTNAIDDAVDSLRYTITKIPWSFEGISGEKIIPVPKKLISQDDLRRGIISHDELNQWAVEGEFDEWNEAYSPDFND